MRLKFYSGKREKKLPEPRPLPHTGPMLGPVIIVIVLVVAIPVGFLMSTSLAAGVIGFLLKDGSEKANADSELLETNY